uniref:Uncharacterized protein n=1 Tax=Anguilla anguilla TaxID=7936 RepID=A0A0E9R449_ANGAN
MVFGQREEEKTSKEYTTHDRCSCYCIKAWSKP